MSSFNKNQDVCSVCEAQPQDMLILSCHHNLCLDCATQVYNLNMKQDKIVCQICLSQTNLDNDTIVCLRSLSAKICQSSQQHSQYQNKVNFPPHPAKTNFSANKNHPKNFQRQQIFQIEQQQLQVLCQRHNEPLTYFCLQCNFYKICSQCMLLQNHRYHKVLTLKKATQHIKQSIEKIGRQKLKLKKLLQKDRQSLSIRKQQSQRQLQINLNDLKITFDELNRIILKRYEEFKNRMQQQANRKLQIMQGAITQISSKIQLIEQTLQFENQLVQSATNSNPNNIFQMFQYYEAQMTQHRVNFEPSLPNFISEVHEQKLNKQKSFKQIQYILQGLQFLNPYQQENIQDQNINYISQIEAENLVQCQIYNQNQDQNSKNHNILLQRKYQGENVSNKKYQYRKVPASQNINIIQVTNKHPKTNKSHQFLNKKSQLINLQRKYVNQSSGAKRPKQGIEEIKRKARQNFKDRQLSNSRKMQLSRSIVNATDILNKIQQRSSKI